MNALVPSLLGIIGSLLAVAATYWLSRSRDREAEWRKEKLAYYKAFVECLSGIVEGDETPEGHRGYARATNNLLLLSPQQVLSALHAYRTATAVGNFTDTRETQQQRLNELLLAIRRDVGVQPPDVPSAFEAILWAAGPQGKDHAHVDQGPARPHEA
jgi:hypothetical protein